MKNFLAQVIIAILGIWLSTIFVPEVFVELSLGSSFFGFDLTQKWQIFLILGLILGSLNYFIKPIIEIITLPLRILTVGLFSFVIEMGLIWVIDLMFVEFSAPFLYPMLWTALIIWGAGVIINRVVS